MDLLKVTIVFLRVSFTGFFAPDVIRFAMYLVAAFVLIKYSRMLAWLFCRDLLESRASPASPEEAPPPMP
jgi:hypothetical protein